MKKRWMFLLVTLIAVLVLCMFAGVAYAQTEEMPDREKWVGFVSSLLAAMVIILPAVSVILIKISAIMKKSAEATEAYQQVQLAIAEGTADGNVDNNELAVIVSKGQTAGVQTKELYVMIKNMIAEAHKKLPQE